MAAVSCACRAPWPHIHGTSFWCPSSHRCRIRCCIVGICDCPGHGRQLCGRSSPRLQGCRNVGGGSMKQVLLCVEASAVASFPGEILRFARTTACPFIVSFREPVLSCCSWSFQTATRAGLASSPRTMLHAGAVSLLLDPATVTLKTPRHSVEN